MEISPDTVATAGKVITGVAVWKGIGGKEMLLKTVGPTLDFAGLEIRNFTERQVNNLKRIVAAAFRKAGDSTEGEVPQRVLHSVINEGIYCEDELAAEYLGGVLASSRVSDLRDDRAASWVNTLSRLTTYQIRAHFIIYATLKKIFTQEPHSAVDHFEHIKKAHRILLLSRPEFVDALELSAESVEEVIHHIQHGLKREELISDWGIAGNDKSRVRVKPTLNGVSLLLWANGHGKNSVDSFLSENIRTNVGIKLPPGWVVGATPTDQGVWL